MDSRVNLSGYAKEMIDKINRYRDELGYGEFEPSLIVEMALSGYLIKLEDLVGLKKRIKESGGKDE